jgi:hypothetical protein
MALSTEQVVAFLKDVIQRKYLPTAKPRMFARKWAHLFPHPYRPDIPHACFGPELEVKTKIRWIKDERRSMFYDEWLPEVRRIARTEVERGYQFTPYHDALTEADHTDLYTLEISLFRAHLKILWEAEDGPWRDVARKALVAYAAAPRIPMDAIARNLPGQKLWNEDLWDVFSWIEKHPNKLKKCGYVNCALDTRLFVTESEDGRRGRHKYCSEDCVRDARAHVSATGPTDPPQPMVAGKRKYRLTEEGRKRIKEGQKARRDKEGATTSTI